MSHIHNYEELLVRMRLALKNWRISEEHGVPLTDDLITRLLLELILDLLGVKVERPVELP